MKFFNKRVLYFNKELSFFLLNCGVVLVFILSMETNPTKQKYLQFIGWGEKPESIHIQIERVNFFMFSTYTPIVAHETGATHLGIFGHFYQISDGQFDYPWWLGSSTLMKERNIFSLSVE